MAKLLFYCIEVQKLSKISMIVIVNALGGQKKMTQLRRYYTIFNLMQCVLIKKSHISDQCYQKNPFWADSSRASLPSTPTLGTLDTTLLVT